MSIYVTEEHINYEILLDKLGTHKNGYEYFVVFKCPKCHRVYLGEYEEYGFYLDPENLGPQIMDNDFRCERCGFIPGKDDVFLHPTPHLDYRVTIDELRASDWSWIEQK